MHWFRTLFASSLLFATAFANASEYSIEGFVVDSENAPVDSAEVSLQTAGTSTFTDALGAFSLSAKTGTEAISSLKSPAAAYAFQNGILHVVAPGSGVNFRVAAFDMNGRSLYKQAEFLSGGTHSFDLNGAIRGHARYLLQVNLGNRKTVTLAKAGEAFSDSLVVKKDGFVLQTVAVDASNLNPTIILERVPAPVLTKRGNGDTTQTVEQGSAIENFNFAFDNCDSVSVEGLPEGMAAQVIVSKKVVNFSGTVTADTGVYHYTLNTVGGYPNISVTGTITVKKTEQVEEPAKPAAGIVVDGYATQNGGTTGGAGGDTVTVSTYADFKAAVQAKEAKVVIVKGTIKTTDGDGYGLKIASNKTIMGKDSSATIYGGLSISGVKNVIVYNLNLQGTYPNPGPSDAIAVNGGSTNVFLSHLNIWDAEDGNLDITGQANYVTVSYVHFWYTLSSHPHRLNSLIGSGASDHPEDFGTLKVTYHHCWFGTLLNERMPRVMYGNAHVYNNYYTATDNLYGIGVGSYGSALIEGNYFYKTNSPILFMYNVYAFILQRNNKFDSTTGTIDGTAEGKIYGERYITTDPYTLLEDPVKLTSVPYAYELDNAKDVPAKVMAQAGPHNL